MVWVAPQGSATMIKSSYSLEQTQVPEVRSSKPKHGVSTSTPKCKRQLRSFARTQHKGGKFSSRTHPQETDPKTKADTVTCQCWLWYSVHNDTKAPSSQCLDEETQFQVQKSRPSLKGRLNNSKLRWVTNSASYKTLIYFQRFSNNPALIQTWITRVLYTQERSRWLQMFCTMFFWLAKLPQTSSSFSKTSRSAKTKFQHLEAWWRAESSALHHTISNKTNTKNFDEITRKPCNAESPATNVHDGNQMSQSQTNIHIQIKR